MLAPNTQCVRFGFGFRRGYRAGMTHITVKGAATRIGCSEQYVGRLLKQQRLQGRREGRSWLVDEASVRGYLDDASAGRRGHDPRPAVPAQEDRRSVERTEPPRSASRSQEPYEVVVAERDRLREALRMMAETVALLSR